MVHDMRTVPRPRHEVSHTLKPLVAVFFRYSGGRDAYVLRVVGGRFGPVLRVRPSHGPNTLHTAR